MNTTPDEPNKQQPEDGNSQDANLTNDNATLINHAPRQADATLVNDNTASVANNNLTQSALNGSEINPEYGDSEDPTFEEMLQNDK